MYAVHLKSEVLFIMTPLLALLYDLRCMKCHISNDGVCISHAWLQKLDWEVELAIVIGKEGKHISKQHAMQHVAGYTVAHDVSARDWQLERNGGQWLLGRVRCGPIVLHSALCCVCMHSVCDPLH